MDQQAGRFIDHEEKESQNPERQTQIEIMPQLGIGEIIEIKGVRFKVKSIESRGRLRLKMLAIPS